MSETGSMERGALPPASDMDPGKQRDVPEPSTSQEVPTLPLWRRIRTQAVAILFAVAVVPAGLIAWWMTGLYQIAVETTEKQIQSAVLAELAGALLGSVDDVRGDAEAVAAALASVAAQSGSQQQAGTQQPSGAQERDPLGTVRAVLASRRNLEAVRFDVPAANVSTVLRRGRVDGADVEPVSQSLRDVVDQRGVAFSVVRPGVALVVVPVPTEAESAGRGYVAATVDLAPLSEKARSIAETRFENANVHLLVADQQRRMVAGFGIPGEVGSPVDTLRIWRLLPDGTPWTTRVGVVTEFADNGRPYVGAIETVADLGWTVAVWRPKAEAYQSLTALGPRFLGAALVVLLGTLVVGVIVARALTRPVLALAGQARLIGQRRWGQIQIPETGTGELAQLATSLRQMATELEGSEARIAREARLRGDLSRFLSQDLVTAIVEGQHSLELGGTRAPVTVLFADVVAFTPLAEGQPAERIVSLLNELFSMLSEIVFRHRGTVDKFIGDCLMAVWGAPFAEKAHAALALEAAGDMMKFLEAANENWKHTYGCELRLAIGINSGEVIVGNIGSTKRMEYTVIGDPVNVAARLEAIAKPNQILLTRSTRDLAARDFEVAPLGAHRLTGRATDTEVFELVL